MGREELLEALLGIIKGPDFPTGALIMGRQGIEDAYRTGRGSITMRSVVQVEEIQGRQCLVVTELPYQVNPDALAQKIADLVREGRMSGIADIRDETSGRTGQRLVIVLKREAVAKVVLNNLYKHTQLQTNFGANMLALVDEVPRTLPLDGFIRHWVDHQMDVIERRTKFRLQQAEDRIHILRGYLKALDALDEVIALIRRSETVDVARDGLIELLEIDEIQANAILNMQLRRLAALERQKILEDHDELQRLIDDLTDILSKPQRQRDIVSTELADIVAKFGDDRRTRIERFEGDMTNEDLIPQEDVVVTITRGGYAKRTRVDQYRSQRRGGKGVRGAQLRGDDIVEHFFTTTTHHWLLFFTNLGRVYRAKGYELPEGSRDAKGQHVANLMAFQPGEQIAQVLAIENYDTAPYLVLATRTGLVKKTRLSEYDSPRAGGLIAVNLRDGDELVSAGLASAMDDLILVSRKGQSVRFHANDDALRPMGRATSGVTGMKFREGDVLMSISVVEHGEDPDLFVVFENGVAKRTPASDYPVKGRAGLGVRVAQVSERGGDLVGALTVDADDEVMVVMEKGKIVRSRVDEIRRTGRNTQGVRFAAPDKGDAIVAVARNNERAVEAGGGGGPSTTLRAPWRRAARPLSAEGVDSAGVGGDAVASDVNRRDGRSLRMAPLTTQTEARSELDRSGWHPWDCRRRLRSSGTGLRSARLRPPAPRRSTPAPHRPPARPVSRASATSTQSAERRGRDDPDGSGRSASGPQTRVPGDRPPAAALRAAPPAGPRRPAAAPGPAPRDDPSGQARRRPRRPVVGDEARVPARGGGRASPASCSPGCCG